MTHKQLQSLLKEYRAIVYELEVKLNATTELLQTELDRLQSTIQSCELTSAVRLPLVMPEISTDTESTPDVTAFCALVDSVTYDELVVIANELKHDELGIWIAFIILTIYQFCKPIVVAAARQSWQSSKQIFKRLEAKSLPYLETLTIKASW
jgi:hypothetical protein